MVHILPNVSALFGAISLHSNLFSHQPWRPSLPEGHCSGTPHKPSQDFAFSWSPIFLPKSNLAIKAAIQLLCYYKEYSETSPEGQNVKDNE